MESDLASQIASRLDIGRTGKRRQHARDPRDRLMVWIDGRTLCDPETEVVLGDITALRRWYMHEGLGSIGLDSAAELWADVLNNKEKVDPTVWNISPGWYYDTCTGELYVLH